MPTFDYDSAMLRSGASKLLKIMNQHCTNVEAWRPEDRAALMRHQLSAPVVFDLRCLALRKPASKGREKTLTVAVAAGIKTFQDLIEYQPAPLALLKLAKEFFKVGAGSSSKRQPQQEVAYMMYLVCIVIARIRCEQRITNLSDRDLIRAVQWAGNQDWIGGESRFLFAEAHEYFDSKAAA